MSQTRPTEVELHNYAAHWIQHGRQLDAWRNAYPNSVTNDRNATKKASKLHQIDDIQATITRLQSETRENQTDEFNLSASELKRTLSRVIDAGERLKTDALGNKIPVNLTAVTSAVGEFNRMNGNHAKVTVDNTSSDGSMSPQRADITDEQLASELAKHGIKRTDS